MTPHTLYLLFHMRETRIPRPLAPAPLPPPPCPRPLAPAPILNKRKSKDALISHEQKDVELQLRLKGPGQEEMRGVIGASVFFVFQAPPATDPVVQWSVQWPNDITILNRARLQGLCRATHEEGYTSTRKSPRNRTWPPGNVPTQRGT